MFSSYFELGLWHILDPKGLDHVLFLLALCAPFQSKHWKQLLILITAFTIGHSITLALAALDLASPNPDTIETLIAITIGITALLNILLPKPDSSVMRIKYVSALFFGLIHGFGFSGYFRMLIGKADEVILPLFAFNIGIEAAQIIVVLALLFFFFIAEKSFKTKARDWNLFLSGMAFGVSLLLLLQRI